MTTTEKHLLPLRYCSSCQERFNPLRLTWVGGHWLCAACYKEPAPVLAEEVPELSEEGIALYERFDRNLHLGIAGGRICFYGISFYMATQHAWVADFLHGVLIADFATWMIQSWHNFLFHQRTVILELIGFAILGNVIWLTDGFIVFPDNPTSLGMAFLSFICVFSIKLSILVKKLMIEDA